MAIPAYDDWMRATALGALQKRSGALKVIDEAIKEYWEKTTPIDKAKAFSAIRLALDAWIREKGANWQNSERNKPPRRIVSELYRAVHEQTFTARDLAALKWQDEQRRLRIIKIFGGKEIVWQAFNTSKDTQSALAAAKMAARGSAPHTVDAGAIREIREHHAHAHQARQDYRPGGWSAVRNVVNTGSGVGFGIASVVQHGPGQNAHERRFGLEGTDHTPGAFNKMMQDLFGGNASHSNINSHLLHTIGADMGAIGHTVLPIIGNITSGAKLLAAWGKVALAKYREYETNKHGHVLATGDVEAAFRGLQTLLDRKVTSETVQAGIQTADFATRTAMSFVDFGAASGTLIGVVSAVSKLIHNLYLLGREYSETRAARVLLSTPANLDYTLFETYPLLGCYMLLCSDLSELIAMSAIEANKGGVPFGAMGWMDDVENIKKNHIDPILSRATSLVYKSPFMIPNMPLHRLYAPTGLDAGMQKLSKANFGYSIAKVTYRVATAV